MRMLLREPFEPQRIQHRGDSTYASDSIEADIEP